MYKLHKCRSVFDIKCFNMWFFCVAEIVCKFQFVNVTQDCAKEAWRNSFCTIKTVRARSFFKFFWAILHINILTYQSY